MSNEQTMLVLSDGETYEGLDLNVQMVCVVTEKGAHLLGEGVPIDHLEDSEIVGTTTLRQYLKADQYPLEDWKYEAKCGYTQLGFVEWRLRRMESDDGTEDWA